MDTDDLKERYWKLSDEGLRQVIEDLKNQLSVAEEQYRGRKEHERMANELGKAMCESIKKLPPVH